MGKGWQTPRLPAVAKAAEISYILFASLTAKKRYRQVMSDESPEIDLILPNLLLEQASLLKDQPLARARDFLLRMQQSPPQSLLIEGGSVNERMAAAIFWACLLNCDQANQEGLSGQRPQQSDQGPDLLSVFAAEQSASPVGRQAVSQAEKKPAFNGPCLACAACVRLRQATHRDFFILDGRTENIKIASVREVRSVLGEPPREASQRIVLLAEAQNLGVEAANALLKSLEEPKPHTRFVLTVPQRERLLPTLVSRSWILTLPWPRPGQSLGAWEEAALQQSGLAPEGLPDQIGGRLEGQTEDQGHNQTHSQVAGEAQDLLDWELALAKFLSTGTGWFARTGSRGALSPQMAAFLLCRCQSALAATLAGANHRAAASPLASLLRSRLAFDQNNLPTPSVLASSGAAHTGQAAAFVARACKAIDACQEALHYNVNPALSLDWLAVRLFIWLEELRRQK